MSNKPEKLTLPQSPASPQDVNKKKDENPLLAVQPAAKKKKGVNWKIFFFGGAIIFVLLVLLLVAIISPKQNTGTKKKFGPTPTMAPRPTVPEFPLGEATVYSNDPQVLQLEGALKTTERELDSVDLREQDIDPPTLQMNVSF